MSADGGHKLLANISVLQQATMPVAKHRLMARLGVRRSAAPMTSDVIIGLEKLPVLRTDNAADIRLDAMSENCVSIFPRCMSFHTAWD